MDRFEYNEAIEDAMQYHRSTMPANVKEAISKAKADLYAGPTYYDKDGNEASCFDEGAIPFDFKAACSLISEYTDNISDLKEIDYYTDEDGEEHEQEESIEDSAQAIVRKLLGKELAQHC